MIPRRLLSPSSISSARLWTGNHLGPISSVSQEFARTLPPAPPLPPRSQRRSIPIPKTSPRPTPQPIVATPIPSKPHNNDATSLRDQQDERLESYFLRILSQVDTTGGAMNLEQLIKDSKEKAGNVLEDVKLNYESNPIPSRRVKTTGVTTTGNQEMEQDGIVVVAHVVGGEKTKVSISSGFVVGDQSNDGTEGRMIITCSHTLNQVSLDAVVLLNKANSVCAHSDRRTLHPNSIILISLLTFRNSDPHFLRACLHRFYPPLLSPLIRFAPPSSLRPTNLLSTNFTLSSSTPITPHKPLPSPYILLNLDPHLPKPSISTH